MSATAAVSEHHQGIDPGADPLDIARTGGWMDGSQAL